VNARSIVTSHPDVQCSFCGRRLLRGEEPDVFFVAGERRIVCQLCGPRAAQEGWLRETHGGPQQEQAHDRAPRGRGLWERLRPRRQSDRSAPSRPARGRHRPRQSGHDQDSSASGSEDFDFDAPAGDPDAPSQPGPPAGALEDHLPEELRSEPAKDATVTLLEAFNASEHASRVASIARLLGPPIVSFRPAPDREETLWITVAWEICWQRYEVDPGDSEGPHRIAEGMELEELSAQDRTPNALADEHGRLHPAPA
jgi:hypothetical protein